ncbi:MAG TPA: amidohydrolase family protein [Longimicrobiales bacterium]|nr:amidohydrolase family protein [Longimicrobiales bacterium]
MTTGAKLLAVLLLAPAALAAQASQGVSGTYVIRGGTVVTGKGETLPNASVLIQDGKIAAIGANVQAPANATVIDAAGKFIYPGLIDSHTDLGLSEIGSVAATQDVNELGEYNPHMKALTAVNPSSELIAVTRANGVTSVVTAPGGGVISGQASLIRLDGWTQDEMAVRPVAGYVINYPRAGGGGRGGRGGGGAQDPEAEREARERAEQAVSELRDYLTRARDYDRVRDGGSRAVDVQLEALRSLFSGEAPAYVMADTKDQIEGALKLGTDFGIKVIIGGGDEAYKLARQLADQKVPVILGSTHSAPAANAPYDAIYAQPGVLHAAGVKFAFSTGDGSNARHVPYHASLAVAYGLPAEAALQALTIWPAEIWGVADRVGSIEVGKSADLFVATGDALDPRTVVNEVFIGGRRIPHDDRHTRLYEKFKARPKK